MSLGLTVSHSLLQEVECPGEGYGLGAALHPQFAAEVQDMFFDGVHAEDEVLGDLPVGRAIHEQP